MSVSLAELLALVAQDDFTLALPGYRVIRVKGKDAQKWLDDLVTTGVAQMQPNEARRSFLLQPTGRIRAEFWVIRPGDSSTDFLLVQAPGQPRSIDSQLSIYQLSSDVDLSIDDTAVTLASAPPGTATWAARFSPGSRPLPGERDEWLLGMSPASPSGAPALPADLWTAIGLATFPESLLPEGLPLEAGDRIGDAIDHAKGCYLGQEAIAKTHNRGRPPFFILWCESTGPVLPGDAVLYGSDHVGKILSVANMGAGTSRILARVRASAAGVALRLGTGSPLQPL